MTGDARLTLVRSSFDDPIVRKLCRRLDQEMDDRYADDDDDEGHSHDPAFEARTEHFEPPRGAFLEARVDGVTVGCAGIRPLPGGGEIAEVKRMYVDPAHRGRGIGRALLEALEDVAREAGYETVWIETGARQPEALSLYRSAGYERIESYGVYRGDALSICFGKRL